MWVMVMPNRIWLLVIRFCEDHNQHKHIHKHKCLYWTTPHLTPPFNLFQTTKKLQMFSHKKLMRFSTIVKSSVELTQISLNQRNLIFSDQIYA